ncbi:hypothetical protein HMPREF3192_00728 [Atopobium deltae]|uniref:Uncharacterized protein n=1 Tax=Atopobium deltae TaxID=1393034 RepID=A0A133XVA5_9ACTN|nr:hypothetical protein HMPREF3192_00728 [Atopobium deltae]
MQPFTYSPDTHLRVGVRVSLSTVHKKYLCSICQMHMILYEKIFRFYA